MGQQLAGARLVFTGQSDIFTRSQIMEIVEDCGGTVGGIVTPETTHLVICGTEQISKRKITAAKLLGALVISDHDLVRLMKQE